MTYQNRDAIQLSLKKARNHIEKIKKMIDDDLNCMDLVQQINAVEGYLRSAKHKLLSDYMNDEYLNLNSSTDDIKKKQVIDNVMRVLKIVK